MEKIFYRTGNHIIYNNLRKYLIENKIDFSIECIPCGMAIFCIKPNIEKVYFLKFEINEIERKAYNLV